MGQRARGLMVYRERAPEEPQVVDDAPDRSLLRLDVSGRAGHWARDGQYGHGGRSGGGSGSGGQPAGPAEAGKSGGTLTVHLAPSPSAPDDELVLTGRLIQPDGTVEDGRNEIVFYDGGYIDLLALGGEGGRGGRGGDGGAGGKGSRGSNATRYSSGGSGGTGGRGGDGGAGSSGAAGGTGGSIELSVAAADTHLVMLVRAEVRGGEGGSAGMNGLGGAGGAGGSGGSSHSWTTTSSYTDSKGKRRTRTRSHSKPGGSRGSSGTSGARARARLVRGRNGPVGKFEIVVRDTDGTEARYGERYRLQLVGFAHVSADEDGVYEPLERIEVTGLVVKNTGGMPTPPNHAVHLMLEPEGWVWPESDEHLVLKASLPAGQVTPVEGSLFFSIGDWVPEGPSEPLEVVDHIVHGAILPAAHRAFDDYHVAGDPKGRFVVRYPVRASALDSLHGLAPGEATRMCFSIESVSGRSYGARGDVGRKVRFRLKSHGSELDERHLVLYDNEERALPFDDGWVLELPVVGKEETLFFEAIVGLDPSAPHYRSATFWLTLELDAADGSAPLRAIQHRAFEIRVAQRYRRVEDCELLLITCHRTTREQMDAWQRLSARAGLPMAVWDVSLEGHLDLEREVGGGTLREHLRGGTVVVLNPTIQVVAGGTARPHRLIDRAQIARLVDASISVAVFGGDKGEVPIARWLVPADGASPETVGESCAALRERLEALEALRGDGKVCVHEVVDVHHIGFWWEHPTEKRLAKRALALSRYLRAEYPNRRFLVSPEHAPELVSKHGPIKRWKVGTLTVRSTFDASKTHVLHWTQTPDASDIDTGAAEQVVLLARDFDQKLEQLAEALRDGRDAWPAVRAILVDLVTEQQAILASKWRHGLSGSDMKRALPLLRKLVAHASELEAPSLDHSHVQPLIELAARLSYYTSSQARWWEWALYPGRRAPRLRMMSDGLVADWLEQVFGQEGTEDEAKERLARAEERVDARMAEFEVSRMEAEPVPSRRYHAHVLMRAPIEWEGVTTDAERLHAAEQRVIDGDRHRAIEAADRADETFRVAVSRIHGDSRQRLLRKVRVAATDGRPAHEADVSADEAAAADVAARGAVS